MGRTEPGSVAQGNRARPLQPSWSSLPEVLPWWSVPPLPPLSWWSRHPRHHRKRPRPERSPLDKPRELFYSPFLLVLWQRVRLPRVAQATLANLGDVSSGSEPERETRRNPRCRQRPRPDRSRVGRSDKSHGPGGGA